MMQMVGAFAEFERAMIRERTSAGLAQAGSEGRVGGRRKKLNPKKRQEIAESVLSGRKVRCRDGAPLRHQRTDRVADRRRTPLGHPYRITVSLQCTEAEMCAWERFCAFAREPERRASPWTAVAARQNCSSAPTVVKWSTPSENTSFEAVSYHHL